jgi:transcriptional regulator with XRE-family HTH domain
MAPSKAAIAAAQKERRKAVSALGPADMRFGIEMTRLREDRALSMAEVSERLDIPKTTLSSIENGYHIPRVEVAFKLAEFYRVSPRRLLSLIRHGLDARVAQEHEQALAAWDLRQGELPFPDDA